MREWMPSRRDRKKFDIDLERGHLAEAELVDWLTAEKIECKADDKATTTGNIFVEYEFEGKPSGIATSDADVWAFRIRDGMWILVNSKLLRKMARLCYNRRVDGGDNKAAKGVLIPLKKMVDGGWIG